MTTQPLAATQKLLDFSSKRPNLASLPRGFAEVNGVGLFFSTTHMGLFRSDGTPEGTSLIRDLEPTLEEDSVPPRIVALDGRGYWTQDDALFTTDGTAEGTTLVEIPGTPGFALTELVAYQGALYFGSTDGLIRSDGTAGGARVVAPIDASGPWQVVSGKLYFACATDAEGPELCVSDGTAAGTVVVKDLVPGPAGASVRVLGGVGRRLLFSANADGLGRALWSTDGTAAGTVQLLAATDGDAVSEFAGPPALMGGVAWMVCTTRATGTELCHTDGSPAGTAVVDVVAGAGSLNPSAPAVLGGKLVFAASRLDVGTELWASDGTVRGTSLLLDILPGPASGVEPIPPVALGDALYFAARSAEASPAGLWRTDGTPEGTRLVKDILAKGAPEVAALSLRESVVVGTHLLFSADDGVHALEPWVTDGTPEGTQLLKDARPPRSAVIPLELREHHGVTYTTTSESPLRRLWRTDGTVGGTGVFQDTPVTDLTSADHWLYYQGGGLWKTDGAPAIRIPLLGRAAQLRPFGGNLAFLSTTPDRGRGLWLTDGTAAGTRLTSPVILDADALAVAGGKLWLNGLDAGRGHELWTGDGTTRGVRVVTDIRPGAADSRPDGFVELNGLTVFAANDGSAGRELWRSDGSAGGTQQIADLVPGPSGSNPSHLFSWNGRVLFTAGDFFGKRAVWITDGTAAGTTVLAGAPADGSAPGFVAWGEFAFFRATDERGNELWRTDGTAAGTVQVSDLDSGPSSSDPRLLRLVSPAGPLVFSASTPSTGNELWQLSGPQGVPELVADLAPGPRSSRPASFGVQGTTLVVVADAGDGYALWAISGIGTDATPPVLTCPADVTVVTQAPSAVAQFVATATDNSGVTPTITSDRPSGAVFSAGNTTVSVAATDGSNNTSRCTFVVRVGPQAPAGGGGGGPGPGPLPGAGGGAVEPAEATAAGGCHAGGSGGLLGVALALSAAAARRRRWALRIAR